MILSAQELYAMEKMAVAGMGNEDGDHTGLAAFDNDAARMVR